MGIEHFAEQIKYNLGFHKYNEVGSYHQGYYFNLEKDTGNVYLKYTIEEGLTKLSIEIRNYLDFEESINALCRLITVDFLSIKFEEDSVELTQDSLKSIFKFTHIRNLEFINLNYSLSEYKFEMIDITHIRELKFHKTSDNEFIDVVLSFDESCVHLLQSFKGTLDSWCSLKHLLNAYQFNYFDVSILEEKLTFDIEASNFNTLKITSFVNPNHLFYSLHLKSFNKLIIKRWRQQ